MTVLLPETKNLFEANGEDYYSLEKKFSSQFEKLGFYITSPFDYERTVPPMRLNSTSMNRLKTISSILQADCLVAAIETPVMFVFRRVPESFKLFSIQSRTKKRSVFVFKAPDSITWSLYEKNVLIRKFDREVRSVAGALRLWNDLMIARKRIFVYSEL